MTRFMKPAAGDRIFGHTIEMQLGRGEMGSVYRALDPTGSRRVALKVLHPRISGNKDLVRRFYKEGEILNRINHPHIVRVYDSGYADGVHVMVMELVSGCAVQEVVAQPGPLAVRSALDICRQLADALETVHGLGYVHRDIKPQNAMIDAEGTVKLMDFGIARSLHSTGSAGGTMAGTIMGTPAYMSPEQCRGEAADARADLYAVGSVLFYLLTGHAPFTGQLLEVMFKIVTDPAPQVRPSRTDVSEPVEAIIRRCLEKNPADRFQSARELREAIESAIGWEMTAPDRTDMAVIIARQIKANLPLAGIVGAEIAAEPLPESGSDVSPAVDHFAETVCYRVAVPECPAEAETHAWTDSPELDAFPLPVACGARYAWTETFPPN